MGNLALIAPKVIFLAKMNILDRDISHYKHTFSINILIMSVPIVRCVECVFYSKRLEEIAVGMGLMQNVRASLRVP